MDANSAAQLPSVRSLETLHNALSLRQLDEFLERVVSTNYRPTASLTSSLQTIPSQSSHNGASSNGGITSGGSTDRAGSVDSTSGAVSCQRDSPKRNGSMPGFSPSSSNSCSNSCCLMEMKDGQLSFYTEPILVHSSILPQGAHSMDMTSARGLGYSGPPSYVSSAPSSPLFVNSSGSSDFPRPVCNDQANFGNACTGNQPHSTAPSSSTGTMDKAFSFGWEDL